jgi:putative hemolysin
MAGLIKGKYVARVADTSADVLAAQSLRGLCFLAGGEDADEFDPLCKHILIETQDTQELVCCFRILALKNGTEINRCYSAQHYDLSALQKFDGSMVEMGRFCIHPAWNDPDILRIAWGAMTGYVDDNNVEMLFGCSSFAGTDATQYSDAFALLRDRHLAPTEWMPQVKSSKIFPFVAQLKDKPDLKLAQLGMPPLLRTYLLMGGWVSDHAVVDDHMNTLHVFTGLEIRAIPPARKRLLRALSG